MESADKVLSGCCSELPTNFSLLKIPDQLEVKLDDPFLWWAVTVTFLEPFFKPVIGVHEHRHEFFSKRVGRNLAFFIYLLVSYLYSSWSFLMLQKTMSSQPGSRELHRNEVLLTGYLFLLAGLMLKVHTYVQKGVAAVMGGVYFKQPIAAPEETTLSSRLYDPYYHPMGTASVMCYFGSALIRASVAGLLLTIVLGFAYLSAFHFERYLLQVTQPKQEQNPAAGDCKRET